MKLTRPRRYQLRKQSLRILASGHPWLYRGQMSSAAEVFADGQWLALHDDANRVVAHGIYEATGAIAIRVLERSARVPDAAWVRERVAAALEKREPLRADTDAFRAIHGENDDLPAVVVDVFADTAVLMTYSTGADALGRLVAAEVRRLLGLARVLWKPAHRRPGAPAGQRTSPAGMTNPIWSASPATATLRALAGRLPPGPLRFREGPLALAADPLAGQKSGAYLDLRGLRRLVLEQPLADRRVLNLFSYTGATGLAAAHAGAAEVWNVDSSAAALAAGEAQHAAPAQRWIAADVFDWLPSLARAETFDLVIADPPPMTSRMEQVPRALAAYHRLYRAAAPHVAPGGLLVACCCTSRIELRELRRTVTDALGAGFTFERRLPHEPDHAPGFLEGDYLKILLFRRSSNPPAT
ncbi:MAG TPA: class I SAM-dependent methyltransferase [Kofleriaceae bacterium]|nr:class I SAM-dependent methyltransferase [Kofleriaceae bacterium]